MGFIRLFLALSVVAGHSHVLVFGIHPFPAFTAVNMFFMISGFYMSLVLNTKYNADQNFTFYVNRVLKIFPTYYVGLILALGVFLILNGSTFFSNMSPFSVFYATFMNIFIIGQDLVSSVCVPNGTGCLDPITSSLNPPAWSIAVELMFYAVAPYIVRNSARTVLFVLTGVFYFYLLSKYQDTIMAFWNKTNPDVSLEILRYNFFPASFMFFGLGALSFLILQKIKIKAFEQAALLGLVAILPIIIVKPIGNLNWYSTIVFFVFLPVIFENTKNIKIDRAIGEFSYPVYVLHFPLLTLIGTTPFGQQHILSLTILASMSIASLVFRYVERPIESLRRQNNRYAAAKKLRQNA